MKNYHSKNKDYIVSYFSNHPDRGYSAKDIYEASLKDEEGMNIATVYRNLEKLSLDGILQKRSIADSEEVFYQYMGKHCHDHLHLYCSSCGKIIHLDCDFMDEINHHLMDEHGFLINSGESMLKGICKECREKGIN